MSLDDRLRRGLRDAARRATVDPDGDLRSGRALARRRRHRARLLTSAGALVLVAGTALTATQIAGGDGSDDSTIAGPGPEPGRRQNPGSSADEDPGTTSPGPDPSDPVDSAPPPVVVSSGDATLELSAFTFCYDRMCADGMPPDPLPDIGAADELRVDFALPDWTIDATFSTADVDCPRTHQMPLEADGDGSFVLRAAGRAGTYDVTLFARGDGDAVYSFRWTTTEDGPVDEPTSRLAVLADHDGRVDSYGVELEVRNLAATPSQAAATITVRGPDGREVTFAAPGDALANCTEEGYLYWTGGLEEGLAAAALSATGPFTYEVVLTLDGVEHRATATWPDDQIVGNEPSVALHFEPALPGLPPP